MFCTNCGKRIDDDAKFCIYCGEKRIDFSVPSGSNGEAGEIPPQDARGQAGEIASADAGDAANETAPADAGSGGAPSVADDLTAPMQEIAPAPVVEPLSDSRAHDAAAGEVPGDRDEASNGDLPAEFAEEAPSAAGQDAVSPGAFRPATVSGPREACAANPQKGQVSKRTVCVAVAVTFAAAFVLFAVVPRAVGLLGGGEETKASEPQSVQVQQQEEQSDQQSEQEAGKSEENSASQKDKENSTQATDKKTIEVKSGIAQYSWSELASIAKEVESKATNRNDAIQIAAKYHLVESDGTLTGETKTLQTSLGDADVFIVDIYKDKGSSGKCAAFTFMTAGVFDNHEMNATDTNSGGWKASEMRSWLNSTVLQSFPDDLRSAVASVGKKTNNVGKTRSTDSVGTTQDSIWLFSWVECLGPIAWNTGSDQSYIDTVDNQEGSQYAWFSQQGAQGVQGHPSLDRTLSGSDEAAVWWMRSSAPNTDTSFGDMGPEIDNGGQASTAEGVVFGFCI